MQRPSAVPDGLALAFIVGYGDIGRRVAALWHEKGGSVAALVRSARDTGPASPVPGDLDHPETLTRLPVHAAVLFHFAPPAPVGLADTRTTHLLVALEDRPPRRIVYISTSGVYGDCGGAWVDETRPVNPGNDRSRRRVDAELQLTDFAARHAIPLVILRVPGIYGPGRLPLSRIRRGDPVVCPRYAPWSNRIHADDLAAIAVRAAQDDAQSGIYNVSDDQPSSMTDYFYRLAEAAGLPRPPCVSLAEARRTFSPELLEYLNESRRLDNRRMKTVLGVKLRYPTLSEGLAEADLIKP
ncbi:MAG: SDR family oxidoreductase [Gammaproteobacteria bacterium]|nr:SDR family oxidoreductase [Gammaproteobacteria bacterium]